MMPGHGPNSVFFNKKTKIGRPKPPSLSDNISFLPQPSSFPQSGRHMCITPY